MSGIIEFLFSRFGFLEVWARRFVYSNEALMVKISNMMKKSDRNSRMSAKPDVIEGLADSVFSYIRSLGIHKGDILIVHSGMEGLLKMGLPPKRIINVLLELVGDEGTLAFPAFPAFDLDDKTDTIHIYDPKETLCWTGTLPNVFIRKYPVVIRSNFPTNSLAAKGFHAEDMMRDNLLGDLPHGKHSAWEYCSNHHAKILYLGVKAYHSLTIMHVAEEIMDSDWPVKNWFEKRKAIIKLPETEIEFEFRARRLFWARYIHEYHTAYTLKKHGFLKEVDIDGIHIGFIPDANDITNFVRSNAEKRKFIFYTMPKKYLK